MNTRLYGQNWLKWKGIGSLGCNDLINCFIFLPRSTVFGWSQVRSQPPANGYSCCGSRFGLHHLSHSCHTCRVEESDKATICQHGVMEISVFVESRSYRGDPRQKPWQEMPVNALYLYPGIHCQSTVLEKTSCYPLGLQYYIGSMLQCYILISYLWLEVMSAIMKSAFSQLPLNTKKIAEMKKLKKLLLIKLKSSLLEGQSGKKRMRINWISSWGCKLNARKWFIDMIWWNQAWNTFCNRMVRRTAYLCIPCHLRHSVWTGLHFLLFLCVELCFNDIDLLFLYSIASFIDFHWVAEVCL